MKTMFKVKKSVKNCEYFKTFGEYIDHLSAGCALGSVASSIGELMSIYKNGESVIEVEQPWHEQLGGSVKGSVFCFVWSSAQWGRSFGEIKNVISYTGLFIASDGSAWSNAEPLPQEMQAKLKAFISGIVNDDNVCNY